MRVEVKNERAISSLTRLVIKGGDIPRVSVLMTVCQRWMGVIIRKVAGYRLIEGGLFNICRYFVSIVCVESHIWFSLDAERLHTRYIRRNSLAILWSVYFGLAWKAVTPVVSDSTSNPFSNVSMSRAPTSSSTCSDSSVAERGTSANPHAL